jgi:hypothetical protein
MSSFDKMKRSKQYKSLTSKPRLIYLTSIAAILTIGGTTFFGFLKKKDEIKPTFQGLKKKPLSIFSVILKWIFGKKKK